MRALVLVAFVIGLSGCAVVSIAGSVVSTAASVVGTVVSTTVDVTGAVVRGTANAIAGGDEKPQQKPQAK